MYIYIYLQRRFACVGFHNKVTFNKLSTPLPCHILWKEGHSMLIFFPLCMLYVYFYMYEQGQSVDID